MGGAPNHSIQRCMGIRLRVGIHDVPLRPPCGVRVHRHRCHRTRCGTSGCLVGRAKICSEPTKQRVSAILLLQLSKALGLLSAPSKSLAIRRRWGAWAIFAIAVLVIALSATLSARTPVAIAVGVLLGVPFGLVAYRAPSLISSSQMEVELRSKQVLIQTIMVGAVTSLVFGLLPSTWFAIAGLPASAGAIAAGLKLLLVGTKVESERDDDAGRDR